MIRLFYWWCCLCCHPHIWTINNTVTVIPDKLAEKLFTLGLTDGTIGSRTSLQIDLSLSELVPEHQDELRCWSWEHLKAVRPSKPGVKPPVSLDFVHALHEKPGSGRMGEWGEDNHQGPTPTKAVLAGGVESLRGNKTQRLWGHQLDQVRSLDLMFSHANRSLLPRESDYPVQQPFPFSLFRPGDHITLWVLLPR